MQILTIREQYIKIHMEESNIEEERNSVEFVEQLVTVLYVFVFSYILHIPFPFARLFASTAQSKSTKLLDNINVHLFFYFRKV